ncbi:MAG: nucleoside monophosphate kinase [Candidatus Pacebacteria bacterium]|nr:nucleoside monophosphate kinase [Candidatus Paceibacterota bacterium]
MSIPKNKKILIMSGFPGSGKSTLAKKISKELGFKYLSTDIIRQEIFNSSRFDSKGHDFVVKIGHRVYEELYDRAISFAQQGKKVIIDGTHLYTEKREKSLKKITEKFSLDEVAFIVAKTDPKVIKKRMSQYREKDNENESLFEAWQRVFKDFENDHLNGLISWPDDSLGIAIVDSEEVYAQLDERN